MISIKSFGFTIKNSGFLSKNAIFLMFLIKTSKIAFFDKNIKNCIFWHFYSKMTDLGVPPIGHFWTFYSKCSKFTNFEVLIKTFKIGHFWIKCSKMADFDVFYSKSADFECFWKKVQNLPILNFFQKPSKSAIFE